MKKQRAETKQTAFPVKTNWILILIIEFEFVYY